MNKNRIIIGICGGIAAYKAIELIRQLQKKDYNCQVVLTESANNFVTPLTLQSISRNAVLSNLFDLDSENKMSHIDLAQNSHSLIVAPATANTIAKFANGIADDLLSTLFLATTAKVIIAPAMNNIMWHNKIVQENLDKLKKQGCIIVEPEEGYLACETIAKGRLAAIEKIVDQISHPQNQRLNGVKCLVTLGATIQPIDPFRYMTNYSSGKMGFHLVNSLLNEGANVTAIVGKTYDIPSFSNVTEIKVDTTEQMANAFDDEAKKNQIIIMAAAVSDYQTTYNKSKIKKDILDIKFDKSKDIIKSFSVKRKKGVITVAFAAESEFNMANAVKKLNDKKLDLLVVNEINEKNKGFAVDFNKATLLNGEKIESLPLLHKSKVADKIIDKIIMIKNEQ